MKRYSARGQHRLTLPGLQRLTCEPSRDNGRSRPHGRLGGNDRRRPKRSRKLRTVSRFATVEWNAEIAFTREFIAYRELQMSAWFVDGGNQ